MNRGGCDCSAVEGSEQAAPLTCNQLLVPRHRQYLALPQEAALIHAEDPGVEAWPTVGKVEFKAIEMRYRPELPPAIAGLSALLEGGQKAGIVGRSGSGKSSLMLSLFRLVEACGGSIEIDGRNIQSMGLLALRRAVTIIPQDPTLFKGSCAHNLDPFGMHTKEALLAALHSTQLPESILDSEVEKGGSNLSSGACARIRCSWPCALSSFHRPQQAPFHRDGSWPCALSCALAPMHALRPRAIRCGASLSAAS